ncbi:MAG: hypothetical protein ABI901_05055 [Roseiflexaceae bacterium]
MAQARRAISLERAVGRIASPSSPALANRPLAQAAPPSIRPNDCAQRPGVQLPRRQLLSSIEATCQNADNLVEHRRRGSDWNAMLGCSDLAL